MVERVRVGGMMANKERKRGSEDKTNERYDEDDEDEHNSDPLRFIFVPLHQEGDDEVGGGGRVEWGKEEEDSKGYYGQSTPYKGGCSTRTTDGSDRASATRDAVPAGHSANTARGRAHVEHDTQHAARSTHRTQDTGHSPKTHATRTRTHFTSC